MDATLDSTTPRTRRWPLAFLGGVVLLLIAISVAGGAARSVADAAGAAAQLEAAGHYALSIAVDNAISRRGGPLYVLDRGDVDNASYNAQRTALRWATALEEAGMVDQALALAGSVTDPRLRSSADMQRGTLLLAAAQRAAARGDYATALTRIGQIKALGLSSGAQVSAQLTRLEPEYQIGEAAALTNAGHGIAAVPLLDDAAQHGSAGAVGELFPKALLAAGDEALSLDSPKEAAALLQRLVASYGGTSQARQAQTLLRKAQPVSGTLVDKSGNPISGEVRLSSHYFNEPGGYLTTGPFYYSNADSAGDFRFSAIPQGGPYVFEVLHNGIWTTFVDPNTNQPANPVSVTPLTPVDLSFITIP